MRFIPPTLEDKELETFLYDIARYLMDLPPSAYYDLKTGLINEPVGNKPVGYLKQWLHIRFAVDSKGTGFGTTTSGCYFYGVYNHDTNTPSSDWGDYTWFPVDPEDPSVGFGSDNLYIKILGNRNCEFKIAASNSDYMFVSVTGAPIDLDELIPDGSIDTDKIQDGAITTPKIADGAVTHAKLDDDAVDTNN